MSLSASQPLEIPLLRILYFVLYPIFKNLIHFFLFLLIYFGPWALNRLTNFVKRQIDDLAAKPIQVHYHKLAMEDKEI